MTTQTNTKTLNGVDVNQLTGTINHIIEYPDLAKFAKSKSRGQEA